MKSPERKQVKNNFQVDHRYLVKPSPVDPGAVSIIVLEVVEHSDFNIKWVFFREEVSGRMEWSDTLNIIKELPLKEEVKKDGRSHRTAKSCR